MERRRNPATNGPTPLKYAPSPAIPGSSTTDFPHPEISDFIRMKEGKIPLKHTVDQTDTPTVENTSFETPVPEPDTPKVVFDLDRRLAAAYDEGWRTGRKLKRNANPYKPQDPRH